MNKVLVIAPHADDEILGCGATMAKYAAEGSEVYVIIATNASIGAPELYSKENIKLVRSEALKAHKIIGVSKTYFLDFPAPALNAFPEYKISIEFSKIFTQLRPTHLYLPHPGDLHQDHNAIYKAALVSARPQGLHKIPNIYCYETLSETEWAPMQGNNSFIPNSFIEISNYFNHKIRAMQSYKSQLRDFPHPRSIETLEALSKFRGATVGVDKAEAFSVERLLVLKC